MSRKSAALNRRSKEEATTVTEALRSVSLPRNLDLQTFVEARMAELDHFLQVLGDKSRGKMTTKRNFQLLPKHMRRRAMSHNAHRIPSRIRSSGKDLAQLKNPCRKSRRHYVKIMQDYTKRNLKALWLESHIWHAKRMKMVEKWGYKVASKCNDKGVRAVYRFSRDSAVVYDKSYQVILKVLEVGRFESVFQVHFDERFRKNMTLTWKQQLIGVVQGIKVGNFGILIVHPGCYQQITDIFKNESVKFEDFKDQTCVFSLRGPRSTEMLSLALDIREPEKLGLLKEAGKFHNFKFPDGALVSINFVKKLHFSQNKQYESVLDSKNFVPEQPSFQLFQVLINWPDGLNNPEFWDGLNENEKILNHLPEKITTRSGRSRYPGPWKKNEDKKEGLGEPEKVISETEKNVFLKEEEKMEIEENKDIEGQTINNEADTQNMDLDEAQAMKSSKTGQAFLIYNKSKHGDGWDIVLKAGENNLVWRSLVYSGCKAVGLQEFKSISYEKSELFFPDDYPSCLAYENHSNDIAKGKILEYFKRPSSKRMNFERILSPFPFFSDWKLGQEEKRRYEQLVPVKIICRNRCPKDLAYICEPALGDLEKKIIKEAVGERTEPNSKCKPEDVYKLAEIKISKKIVGFVTSGGFSFKRCKGFGLGHVAIEFSSSLPCRALFRNPTSQFYHKCELKKLAIN